MAFLTSLRQRLGVRGIVLLESAIFLGAALAIDGLFLDGSRFRSSCQHPFWALVLLTSVQYGTNSGLLAAALSTAALLTGNLPEQTVSQDSYAFTLDVIKQPLMWFIAAIILGELRMRHIQSANTLRERLQKAEERERTIAEAYDRLDKAKQSLEVRVAGQLKTAVSVHEAAKSIEKLEPSEVLFGVVGLVRSVMGPSKFSLFLLNEGVLEAAVQEGWTSEDRFPGHYNADSEIFREVVGRQRLLCVANTIDQRILGDEGMLAAPVFATDSGQILGMLKIEKLGFLDLNFSSVQTFKAVCEWIGTAYGNACRYENAKEESMVNESSDLFSYGFLSRQISVLTQLAERINFDLSMVMLEIQNRHELSESASAAIPAALSRAVARVLRKTDLAFDYQRTGTEFAIVLPAASPVQARVVCDKLLGALTEELDGDAASARFHFGIHALHEARQAVPVAG